MKIVNRTWRNLKLPEMTGMSSGNQSHATNLKNLISPRRRHANTQ